MFTSSFALMMLKIAFILPIQQSFTFLLKGRVDMVLYIMFVRSMYGFIPFVILGAMYGIKVSLIAMSIWFVLGFCLNVMIYKLNS